MNVEKVIKVMVSITALLTAGAEVLKQANQYIQAKKDSTNNAAENE